LVRTDNRGKKKKPQPKRDSVYDFWKKFQEARSEALGTHRGRTKDVNLPGGEKNRR